MIYCDSWTVDMLSMKPFPLNQRPFDKELQTAIRVSVTGGRNIKTDTSTLGFFNLLGGNPITGKHVTWVPNSICAYKNPVASIKRDLAYLKLILISDPCRQW